MLTVGTESYREDRINVILEILDLLPGGDIPQLYHFVVAARRQQLSVCTPRDGVYAILVALEGFEKLVRTYIPNFDFPDALGRPAGCCQHIAVRAESERTDIICMAGEGCANSLPGG